MKNWKPFYDECPRCGSEAEVFTSAQQDGYAYDGDDARCVECDLKGGVMVYDESLGHACIQWQDFD